MSDGGTGKLKRRPGDRAGLSREQVLRAARDLADHEGVDALTMRRLADRLGVAPNTIYSHYADKAALLDALLDSLLADIEVPDVRRADWRDGLVELMRESRTVLLANADLLPHLLSRPMRGRNASRLAEAALALLEQGGIEGPPAVDALRALLTYTFGSVALDARRRADPDLARREAESAAAFGSMTDLRRVAALAELLARPPVGATFETAIRWLIDGIARETSASGAPRTRGGARR